MSDVTNYTFKIHNFTPDSMPFGRLVQYYVEIKKMLGMAENLHLVGIFESSHGSTFAIDKNHESSLQKRLADIKDGTAPARAISAQSEINEMLKQDGTSGEFFDTTNQNVIQFPGKGYSEQVQVRIRDAAIFTGELYHIAGTKDDVNVRINTHAYGVVYCTTTRDIGKALRDFLFEEVKVSGRGMWNRNENGIWKVDDFSIIEFKPVIKENLRTAVDRIRALEVNWPEDPLGDIRIFEESGGQVH